MCLSFKEKKIILNIFNIYKYYKLGFKEMYAI